MPGYSVKIVETSKELTARERVKLKATDDCASLDEATKDGALLITVDGFAVLEVHNEKSDNKDYTKYILMDKDGTRYITGSNPLWTSFMDIYDEIAGEDLEAEPLQICVYQRESKNYKGKAFLTCSIA